MSLKYKQKLFIFDSREIGALLLLFASGLAFAFTLGVHYTKQLRNPEKTQSKEPFKPVEESAEAVPSQVELTEQNQKIEESLSESLQKDLHDEVVKTGIRLKVSRQVSLPKTTRGHEGGATTLKEKSEVAPKPKGEED